MAIVEFRTYALKPGTVAQWEAGFAAALPGRLKHSALAGLWHTEIGPLNQVIHAWPYRDLAHRTEVRDLAAKEPGWPPPGDVILNMDSQIWTPAPFSPPFEGPKKLGNVYEMRIYQYQAGAIPKVMSIWEKSLPERTKLSPIAGCFYIEQDNLNLWMHIWPYASLVERHRIREESRKLPNWPPPTREWLVSQESKLVLPAACSPLA